jgi:hypothetical protein
VIVNIIWKLLLAGFGNNHLHQIIYPCTGGCYDGLEENYVNSIREQSTVSYLMARLTMEKVRGEMEKNKILIKNKSLVLNPLAKCYFY